jgi:hypothetical protein
MLDTEFEDNVTYRTATGKRQDTSSYTAAVVRLWLCKQRPCLCSSHNVTHKTIEELLEQGFSAMFERWLSDATIEEMFFGGVICVVSAEAI